MRYAQPLTSRLCGAVWCYVVLCGAVWCCDVCDVLCCVVRLVVSPHMTLSSCVCSSRDVMEGEDVDHPEDEDNMHCVQVGVGACACAACVKSPILLVEFQSIFHAVWVCWENTPFDRLSSHISNGEIPIELLYSTRGGDITRRPPHPPVFHPRLFRWPIWRLVPSPTPTSTAPSRALSLPA